MTRTALTACPPGWLRAGRMCCSDRPASGKSTLINRLAGLEIQATGDVREQDGKGRHTTTARELFRLPNGALVIDTPGLRAVGWLVMATA